jgi:hypothetical protein
MADVGIDLQDQRLTDYPGTGPLPDGALAFVQNPVTRKSHRATVGRLRGPGGTGDSAPFDITPAVSDGDIKAGTTYTNITSEELWRLKLEPYLVPGFGLFNLAGESTRTVPVGKQFPAGFKAATWSISNAGNTQDNSITLRDVTANTILASNEANDGTASVSTAGFAATLGLSRTYLISATNSKGDVFFRDLSIYGETEAYLGLSTATSLSGAQLVGLGNAQLQGSRNRTASGVTASGGQYLYYAYDSRHGDLTSIILDGAAPVLGAFQKLGDVVTTNATGASVTLRVYRSNATNAFSNNSLAFA